MLLFVIIQLIIVDESLRTDVASILGFLLFLRLLPLCFQHGKVFGFYLVR